MKKYLNKALIYKEWKSIWWMIIPMLMFNYRYLIMQNLVNNTLLYNNIMSRDILGDNGTILVRQLNIINILLLMGIAFYIMHKDERNREFFCYLPFTKEQQLVAKVVSVMGVIFISVLVEAVPSCMIYFSNADVFAAKISFSYIISYFILKILVYICAFLICIYAQCVASNSYFGAVLGFSIIHLPASIGSFFSLIFIDGGFNAQMYSAYVIIDNIIDIFYLPSYILDVYNYKIYILILKGLILCVVLFILFKCTLRLIKNTRVEEDKIIMSNKKKTVFKILVSISIGSFFAYIIQLSLINVDRRFFIVFIYLAFIMCTYYIYPLLDKMFKLSKL